jgi:hypothetical protein
MSLFKGKGFSKADLRMCRVHTERFYYLCGHSQWMETRHDSFCGNCDKTNAFRMQIWINHLCPSCRPPETEDPEDDGPEEEEAAWMARLVQSRKAANERARFKSRAKAFKFAFCLYQVARLAKDSTLGPSGRIGYAQDPILKEVNTQPVPPGTIPLDFMPDKHLIDTTEFLKPKIKIVPPGIIPEGSEKCGVCWGSLVADGEDACDGGGARMLPCSHIFGKGCIANVFDQWNFCPLCTKNYRVRRRAVSFADASSPGIDGRWLAAARSVPLLLMSPIFLAVIVTMDVGRPVLPHDPVRNASLCKKILAAVVCIACYPVICGIMIYHEVTGANRLPL